MAPSITLVNFPTSLVVSFGTQPAESMVGSIVEGARVSEVVNEIIEVGVIVEVGVSVEVGVMVEVGVSVEVRVGVEVVVQVEVRV